MFKKLKSHSPNEFLWIVFGVLCLMLFIHISVQANIQREEQAEQAVVTQEPTYLEIHYGNGDVYTVKTKSVVAGINCGNGLYLSFHRKHLYVSPTSTYCGWLLPSPCA